MNSLPAEFAGLRDGAHRLQLGDGRRAFVKVRRAAPVDFFSAEVRGLAAIAATSTLRVPAVFAVEVQFIALEDLGNGRATAHDWVAAGRGLAALHRTTSDEFGFDADGYCGDSPQDNTRDADGFRFFTERRLLPQARRALDNGWLERRDALRVEALCTRLPDLLPRRTPVLIHGDLWSGNLHSCANGELALIDAAAAHYGWAECDLAMLVLFGEPAATFFTAYEASARIDPGWRARAPLLNLYHLLNHLNLFGGGYLVAVRDVLDRFA